MRIPLIIAAAAISLNALGAVAAAGPEWCDDGSPPPNDWRFRKTGAPSDTSAMSWLNSTTAGTLSLRAGINTLEGGVADGMRRAMLRAPSQDELEERRQVRRPAQQAAPPRDGEDDD